MAYDGFLADRVSRYFEERKVDFYSKKMFGGLCFMVDEKMCVGIREDMIMARIDPADEEEIRQREGVKDMDFTGKPMKGFLYVGSAAIDTDEGLDFILDKALAFNPLAKMSKKRSKKN